MAYYNYRSLFVWVSLIYHACEVRCQSTTKPNIIFIFADDLGYNDVSYNGKFYGSSVQTPNIDRLAAEGVILGNYYVQPTCSPSRIQLMTGRSQIYMGFQHGVIDPCEESCVPLDEVTLAQKMKEAGYSTHMVGKWHLGFYKQECLPTKRGFDTFLGFYVGGQYYYNHTIFSQVGNVMVNGYDFHEDTTDSFRTACEHAGRYSTLVFTDETQKIIKNREPSKPLFIYLSYQTPHAPLEVPEKYTEQYDNLQAYEDRRIYAGMMSSLDEAIDNITVTLKDAGIYENTIIIFSTDNGGSTDDAGNNWPLRGSKISNWEGGIHGVGFIHSPLLPDQIKGTTSQAFIHVSDWFPTLVSGLAGGNLAGTKPLDGYDVWDAIINAKPTARTELLINIDPLVQIGQPDPSLPFDTTIQAAIRMGDWKILTGAPGRDNDWTPPPESGISPFGLDEPEEKNLWLFNITADPYERQDLSASNPTIVNTMLARIQEYYEIMLPPIDPPGVIECNPINHSGVWEPWE